MRCTPDGQQKELEQLCETVEQRDAEIQHLKQHVATLQEDLQNCLMLSRTSIAEILLIFEWCVIAWQECQTCVPATRKKVKRARKRVTLVRVLN